MENKEKRIFNIALIQNTVIDDKQVNNKRAQELIDVAVNVHKADIVVLPEYFNCPFGLPGKLKEYAEEFESSETIEFLKEIAKRYNIYLIGGSFPLKNGDKIYNANFNFDRIGELKSSFKKLHLFDVNIPGKMVFKESDNVSPGNDFGVFDTEYGRIGIGICYDIRFPEYALLLRKEYNIDMLIYPAAFNTTTGPLHWELLGRSRAMDNHVYVALCSPARSECDLGYPVHGYSMIVDPFGQIVTQTGYQEAIVVSKIDLAKNDQIRQQIPVWSQKRYDLYDLVKK
jgi:omega-amidase